MMTVLRGCVKATGSKEVGRAVEESNVMGSISVVVFDTRFLRESRQMEMCTTDVQGSGNLSLE